MKKLALIIIFTLSTIFPAQALDWENTFDGLVLVTGKATDPYKAINENIRPCTTLHKIKNMQTQNKRIWHEARTANMQWESTIPKNTKPYKTTQDKVMKERTV